MTQPDLADCVKIEGSDIGRIITLEVPDADGDGTVSVTFTGWVGKDGENGEYVGFDLDLDATFYVKSGTEIVLASGSSWLNPNGTSGSAAKGISYVAICTGGDGGEEPPPVDCDLNDDGDSTDEGECEYVPPPPPVDCDHNDDGDSTDEGECDYVPPPPPPPVDCDHNDDGDSTDEGECDYVAPPPADCDHNDDGDNTDHGECDYVAPPTTNPCDHNADGDTTDMDECDYVCPNP